MDAVRGEGTTRTSRVRVRDILAIREIRAVIFATFVVMLGYGILSPVLPLYAKSFGVGYDSVGLLVSAFAFARLLFDLVSGPLVNRFGQRAVVVVGAVIVGISSAAAAMAPTFPLLVAFRAAGGAGSSIFFAGLMSYLLVTAPRDLMGRVMSVFYGAFNVGIILGNPVGGVVSDWFGLASPLWFYAGACFIAALMYARTVRDPVRPAEEGPRPGLRQLSWNRSFVAVLVANATYFWFVAGVISTLLALFAHDELGFTTLGVGLALAILSVAEFAVLFPAGSMTDRLGRKAVLLPSMIAIAATVALTGFATTTVTFVIALAVLGVVSGFGGVPQSVMLADVVPPRLQPAAIGVYRFVGDLGFVIGPLLAGWMASEFGFTAAFAVSALPCLAAAALLATIPETKPTLAARTTNSAAADVVELDERRRERGSA
jgi:MFS transporter, ACDE family, multidrug resistance protein